MPTERRKAIARAFSLLAPMAPYVDAEAIRDAAGSRRMKTLPPTVAVWLAAIAHIRHLHTDYDALLEEGYDREAARHFVLPAVNDVLTRWRATRLLEADDPEVD
jgi:hypothetical protein